MTVRPIARKTVRRKQLALLLPAHNEELILATTIRSAISAGQRREHIYVVDDASSDATRREALRHLPAQNVLSVERSGKAGAVRKAIKHFKLEKKYLWLHIADADSLFCPNYFRIYRQQLDTSKYAAAVGFVQSMRGNWLAHYRCFSYTYGQHIFRRLQGWLRMISVMPGPVSCFRTDILQHLNFNTGSTTEDFDLTLQIHRLRLGGIVFIPAAVNYTQDPKTLRDFIRQTLRWQRGFFQGVRRYRLCLQRQRIDLCIGFTFLEAALYLAQVFVVMPLLLSSNNTQMALTIVVADFILLSILAILSAIAAQRATVLTALLYYHPLRIIEVTIFFIALVEVLIMRRLQTNKAGWDTASRRYRLDDNAMQDISQ